MSVEIEAKIKVDRLDDYPYRLKEIEAEFAGQEIQRDYFFDRADRSLFASDSGLRIRQISGGGKTKMCFKGPREGGTYKRREEIEFAIEDVTTGREFLEALGYLVTLVFEKHRSIWRLRGCEVCLDEVARLGSFVEIEGPDEAAVAAVQKRLGLRGLPIIHQSYAAMLAEALGQADGKGPAEALFNK